MEITYQWALHGLVIEFIIVCGKLLSNATIAPVKLNWLGRAGDSTQQDVPTA
jgi:hypothetical protein